MKIDIKKIATALEKLSVEELYNWNFPRDENDEESIFDAKELETLNEGSLFKANVLLKEILRKKITTAYNNNQKQLHNIYRWIVKDWGGIRSGNDKKLFNLADKATQDETLSFERIASTSKILSFYKPSKHVIYDARIIYSLNALMLLENASDKYFPMPAGRNSKMTAFDINVLIRLKHKADIYNRHDDNSRNLISEADQSLFIPKNDAYDKFRKIVIDLHSTLYSDKTEKPFYTEMLLFAIADSHIYNRILNEVELKII